MKPKSIELEKAFAVLKPDMSVEPIPVTPELYDRLDADYAGFKSHVLISSFVFSESWTTWEKHPAGDEVVILLSGAATIVLQTGSGEENVALKIPGSCLIVPRDTWHTARVTEPTRMIFITPGEGTENRDVASGP